MKFHWERQEQTGEFTVEAPTVEKCMEIADEEIEEGKAVMTDWYVI